MVDTHLELVTKAGLKKKSPPGQRRAGHEEGNVALRLQGVGALPVFSLGGRERQAHLPANRSGQVPTDGMRLPAGGFHQLFECGAVRPFQQFQDLRGFAALARTRFLLSGFGGLRALGRLGALLGLLPRLALAGRNTGLPCASGALLTGLGLLGSAYGLGDGFGFDIRRVHSKCSFGGDYRVTTSITLVGNGSKRILTPKGDGKAMLQPQMAPEGT